MANRIEVSDATRKGVALAIGALCVCVVGAMLAVGRGSGSTGLQAARGGLAPGAASAPRGLGGSSDGYGGTDDGARAPGGAGDGFDRFRTCLAEQGVTPAERGQQRRAQPDDDLRAAFEACRQYLPERPFGPGGGRGFGPPSGSAPPSQRSDDGSPADGTF
jgi:hypothetical protein